MLRFEYPLALLGLFPVLAFCIFIFRKGKHSPEGVSARRLLLIAIGFTACVFGLGRPQWGQKVTTRQGMKSNLFFVIDISRSMLAQDVIPSRLDFAIAFSRKLLTQVTGMKVAIFPFATLGYTQLPLTTDLFAAGDILLSLHPSTTTSQGTDITAALGALLTQISKMEISAREQGQDWMPSQVVLLSDGETHHALSDDILKQYRNRKIPVFTIAIGTTSGGIIPLETRFGGKEALKTADGQSVITKLNPENLKKISRATGGDYFNARIEDAYRLAGKLMQGAQMGRLTASFKIDREYYPYLFTLALVAFFVELLFGTWEYSLRLLFIPLLLAGVLGSHHSAQAQSDPFPPPTLRLEPEPPPPKDDQERAVDAYNQGVAAATSSPGKAMELFQESALLTKDNELKKKALYNLGNAMLRSGDPGQALRAYQQAYDTSTGSQRFTNEANGIISENMTLASKVLEQMKQQSQGSDKKDSDEKSKGKGQDPKGPKKDYKPELFDEEQKKKIFDLMASEEQQTIQKIQENRNRSQSQKTEEKPW